MNKEKEFLDFIISDSEVLKISWSEEEGWSVLNQDFSKLDIAMEVDGIAHQELIETENMQAIRSLIFEDDQQIFDVFTKKILSGLAKADEFMPIEDNRQSVCMRVLNKNGIYVYHRLDCWMKKNLEGAITDLLLLIYRMNETEVYQLTFSQCMSNDRNPSILMKQATQMIRENPDRKYVMIQFDVPKFKLFNEMYGENVGDELLEFLIDGLQVVCDKEQLYARLSADVYMIVTAYETVEDIYALIAKLDDTLLGFKNLNYSLVYGVNFVEDISEGLRKIGDGAAFARQSVKNEALKHIAFYEADMKEKARIKKFVEDNMERALKEDEFVMFLQPKFSISKDVMVGAEALVRWFHDGEMISPMHFVPIFEQNGFIIKMDQYIWEQACKTIRNWMDQGISPVPISVNVSRCHLKDDNFVQVLNDLIEKYQIPKEYLEIEITETVEDVAVSNGINLLKEYGYKLLMDDFGSGYSSLNMLKDTPFDVIKMDRGFLSDFINSERGQKIVQSTIQMTKNIGLDLIAEGVETKEQVLFLKDCGCDVVQGFYYAKPMRLEEFDEMMA